MYNNIHVFIITFLLHVSTLIVPSSGCTFVYAQRYCYIFDYVCFHLYLQLFKTHVCFIQRGTSNVLSVHKKSSP